MTTSKEIIKKPNQKNNILLTDFLNLFTNKIEQQLYAKIIRDSCANLNVFPTLEVNIITTSLPLKLENFNISPFGMDNTPRMSSDGIVFFGYSNRINLFDFTFPMPPNSNRDNKESHSLLFVIFFNPYDITYYIRNIEKGLGAFMKIIKYNIEDNSLISIGDTYLVLSFESNISTMSTPTTALVIKVFNSQIQNQTIKFNKSDQIIRIGRGVDCELSIEDCLLSKIQCIITYSNGKWLLSDGDGSKLSTNGTWSYIIEPAIINNDFVFKANHTLFKIFLK